MLATNVMNVHPPDESETTSRLLLASSYDRSVSVVYQTSIWAADTQSSASRETALARIKSLGSLPDANINNSGPGALRKFLDAVRSGERPSN
jgi:hypothetical protein